MNFSDVKEINGMIHNSRGDTNSDKRDNDVLNELMEFRHIKNPSANSYERILDYEKILNDTPPPSHNLSRMQTPALQKIIEHSRKENETLEDIIKDVENLFKRRTSNAIKKQLRRALSINSRRAASSDRVLVHTHTISNLDNLDESDYPEENHKAFFTKLTEVNVTKSHSQLLNMKSFLTSNLSSMKSV
jgi:hypothetical protein